MRPIIHAGLLLIFMATGAFATPPTPERLDLSMPYAIVDWLEYVRAGNSDEAIRTYFIQRVAPTPGCRVIIRHWARFRKDWNNETFCGFILEALGRRPAPGPEKNTDGTLTAFGRRKMLWIEALRHPEELQRRLDEIVALDLMRNAREKAAAALPPDTPLQNRFSLVMFGASSAFSVGDENGIDLLQLPERSDGRLDLDEVTDILAHELHHTGFFHWLNRMHPDLKFGPVLLAGVLAAEGTASHFIDHVADHIPEYRLRRGTIYQDAAGDWVRHTRALPELYRRAAKDSLDLLEGRRKAAEVQKEWMAGAKGPAYVLGADMIARIENELGRKAVFCVIRDSRTLVSTYNRAARRAAARGERVFLFPEDLARRLENHSDPGS